MDQVGPTVALSDELHAMKYRGPGENFREFANRVATALADDDRHRREFRQLLLDMRFLPAGRVQAAMGSPRNVTPYNCFVSNTIQDWLVGKDGILDAFGEAMQTMRMGGGIGYDFSTIRPRGDSIATLQSQASGPVSFMTIFDAGCKTIASAGHRRGAQMGVLRIDHPDVEEFVRAKQNSTNLTAFNISLGVTDEFMDCLATGKPFQLRFGGRNYREIDPQALWEMVMRSTWDWAEPGILFIDTINRMNNLWYCENIAASNPCAEQPLPPYGACLLGSVNLVKYITPSYCFDYVQLAKDIPHIIRAMDNVVDLARYPLERQELEARRKRRMGIGVTGLANTVELILFHQNAHVEAISGLSYLRPDWQYGSNSFVSMATGILNFIRNECYLASAFLARDKGPFPLYDQNSYLTGQFIRTLPPHIRDVIFDYGIRNSHVTSIAPTGTISLCADNVSSGIEPVFAHEFERTIQTFEGPRVELVQDYNVREHTLRGKTARECSIEDHLALLLAGSAFADSAVSKTCNVSPDMPWEEFKGVYQRAYEGGAKGCTTFNPEGKRMGILRVRADDDASNGGACYIDAETGARSCE